MTANPPRLIIKVGSVLLLWLLSVSFSTAMPLRPSPAKYCDGTTTTLHKLIRQAHKIGGPLAKKRLHGFGIRRQPRAGVIQRAAHRAGHDDDQAIQNDTAALELAGDVRIALEPAGAFIGAAESPASTHVFPPRPPRGPPNAA
jgi:hypothetical protein